MQSQHSGWIRIGRRSLLLIGDHAVSGADYGCRDGFGLRSARSAPSPRSIGFTGDTVGSVENCCRRFVPASRLATGI